MKLWRVGLDERVWYLMVVGPLIRFRGEPLAESWVPPTVSLYRTRIEDSDLPIRRRRPAQEARLIDAGGGTFGVLSPPAELRDFLERFGELLPVEGDDTDEPVLLYNITTVLDCVDRQRSTLAYFSTGEVMSVKRLVPIESRVPDVAIFKTNLHWPVIYVTEGARLELERVGGTGRRYELEYDSDLAVQPKNFLGF
jgi:hypothetical protein